MAQVPEELSWPPMCAHLPASFDTCARSWNASLSKGKTSALSRNGLACTFKQMPLKIAQGREHVISKSAERFLRFLALPMQWISKPKERTWVRVGTLLTLLGKRKVQGRQEGKQKHSERNFSKQTSEKHIYNIAFSLWLSFEKFFSFITCF